MPHANQGFQLFHWSVPPGGDTSFCANFVYARQGPEGKPHRVFLNWGAMVHEGNWYDLDEGIALGLQQFELGPGETLENN
jgi:hypothetical protein